MKTSTAKKANPKSNRSKRRKNRNFTMSRPNRRALKRLNSSLKGHEECVRLGDANSYVKPGAMKAW